MLPIPPLIKVSFTVVKVSKSKRDVNEVDLVDLVLDGGNPEDMMGEESEWAENKRPTANAQIVWDILSLLFMMCILIQ